MPDIDALLNTNLDDTPDRLPLLPKALYDVEVIRLTKEDGRLDLLARTTEPQRAVDGTMLPQGQLLRGAVFLTASQYDTDDTIKIKLRQLSRCFGVSGSIEPVEKFSGRIGKVRVGIQSGKDGYPDQNKIVGFVVPAA